MSKTLDESALAYHRRAPAGKIEVTPTKPVATQRDLALAYSPGVAAACRAIVEDRSEALEMTAKGNLVAVITNGTAVLGLGDIGPLAAKPVMEGKAVLFKKFAGIDVFDIELNEKDPSKIVDIIAAMEPTFGGINLEDIKAPECFEIEEALQKRVNIPVFHDDQHGTAIIVCAAILNALRLTEKELSKVKLVTSGAGAAAIACLDLLVDMGLRIENIIATDIHGVVYEGRTEEMGPRKARYAKDTNARTLAEVIEGADIFLGLSAPDVLSADMVKKMADRPIIMALANPNPEIMPDIAREARPDAIIATGRSDFPNQVNNVLCFPFIFRGALDVGARNINKEMKLAAVKAIADLAMAEPHEAVSAAYGNENLAFGPENLITKPFDPRLMASVAPAVAKAAMVSGVARKKIDDFDAYTRGLNEFVYRSGIVMRPIFERAKTDLKRIAYAEGEERRVLQAVQTVVDENLARPIVIGRRQVVEHRIDHWGLRLKIDQDFELVDPTDDPRYTDYWRSYHDMMERSGVTPDTARTIVRTNTTVIAALMVQRGDADAMICGVTGQYINHLKDVTDIVGLSDNAQACAAMSLLILDKGTFFICDTHVTPNPTAEQLADMTLLAAEEVERFGMVPKVGILSHSNFGTRNNKSALKMRDCVKILRQRAPDLQVEGEMHANTAIDEEVRNLIFPNSKLQGSANLLMMPNLDAANIAFNLLKTLGDGISVGPILLGANQPAHIVTPSISVRGLINMSAFAAVDAQLSGA